MSRHSSGDKTSFAAKASFGLVGGKFSNSLRRTKLENDIKLLIFTWNVGNAAPKEEELALWLDAEGDDYDLIVVGTQENAYKDDGVAKFASGSATMADSDDDDGATPWPLAPVIAAKKLVHYAAASSSTPEADGTPEGGGTATRESRVSQASTSSVSSKPKTPTNVKSRPSRISRSGTRGSVSAWDAMIAKRLGPAYQSAASVSLWEMRLNVYALRKHCKGGEMCISDVETSKEATGIAGVGGNKGGLIAALKFGSTRLCFISSHLAAHAHKNDARNANCREILSNTARKIGTDRLDATNEYDHVFWLGDLNYRIDLNLKTPQPSEEEEMPQPEMHAKVLEMIEQLKFDELLTFDQLRNSRALGEGWAGFVEGDSAFAPTFKVRRVENTTYKEQRIPSYCDRVLWKSMPALSTAVMQTFLRSVPGVSTSDHKPVVSGFAITPSPLVELKRKSSYSHRSVHTPRHFEPAVVVRLSELRIDTLVEADIGGGSDPRLFFFTSPPGILTADKNLLSTKPRKIASGEASQGLTFSERELPLLMPRVNDIHELQRVTLILSLVDQDVLTKDDPMGTVLVSLAHPGGPDALRGATSYEVPIESKLVLYNTTKGMGTLSGKLTITYGSTEHINRTIKEADESGVGIEAILLKPGKTACGSCAIL